MHRPRRYADAMSRRRRSPSTRPATAGRSGAGFQIAGEVQRRRARDGRPRQRFAQARSRGFTKCVAESSTAKRRPGRACFSMAGIGAARHIHGRQLARCRSAAAWPRPPERAFASAGDATARRHGQRLSLYRMHCHGGFRPRWPMPPG